MKEEEWKAAKPDIKLVNKTGISRRESLRFSDCYAIGPVSADLISFTNKACSL